MGKLRMGAGILLILAGMGIYAYPVLKEWWFDRQVQTAILDFEQRYHSADGTDEAGMDAGEADLTREDVYTPVHDLEDHTAAENFDGLYEAMLEYNEALLQNGQKLTDAWSYQQEPVNLSAYHITDQMVGYIEIPDMDVLLPLYLGASAQNLASGAAVLSQTSLPVGGVSSNCVIAGHRGYGGMAYFREIERLTQDSLVYIVNPWETLIYQVTETRIIDPKDIASILIQEGKDMVTLITCHPYLSNGRYRFVVYCERVEDAGSANLQTVRDGEGTALAESEGGETATAESCDGMVDESGTITGNTAVEKTVDAGSSKALIRAEKVCRLILPAVIMACFGIWFFHRKFWQK
ncbi:MAG: class C sortase [Lachnospiraceae bacterium]|nr:class C sortase [Lachnospiraceae bacterium]